MDITINKAQKAKPDPIGDYTTPIARTGEQQFACIMRNRSGVSSGEIDFGARFIDRLCDGDQQSAVNSAFAIYEKWCRETGKRAPRDKSELLEKDFAYHVELCTSQQARIGALTAEVEEQARLLGASGSREAELMARIEALEKAAQRRVDCGHDDECGGRQKDRCGCGHTELENALEMLLP